MPGVLILNQSYEALSICSVKKALTLLFLGKAEMTSFDNRKVIRSISQEFSMAKRDSFKTVCQRPL